MRAVFFGDVPHRLAGAQRSLLAALRQLELFGVEPTVVFPGTGRFEEACRDAGLRVRVLEAPEAFQTFGRALTRMSLASQAGVVATEVLPYCWRLARLIDEERAEVVHYNTPRGIIMAGLAARLAGRSSVLHLRGVPAIGRRYWLTAQALGDWYVLVARALERDFVPAARRRCRVVYNGVDVQPPLARGAAREILRGIVPGGARLDDSATVFVSLSSPVPFKGLHHLLTAAAAARSRGVDATYLLAGVGLDDEYEAWLRRRAAELGVADCVHFIGFVENTLPLLRAADALILPSVEHEELVLDDGTRLSVHGTEGLPRSVLEAMAAAIPVIATRVAGVEEQVEHGGTGMVVEPGDPSALADALVRVARDRPWREAAGLRALDAVRERFTVSAAARDLAAVLRNAARTPRASERWRDAASLLYSAAVGNATTRYTNRLGTAFRRTSPLPSESLEH